MTTSVSQPSATSVQVNRELIKSLITANYSELRNIKVNVKGFPYTIRAKYKGRQIYSKSYNVKKVIIRFFEDLNRKVYLEPYIEA